MLAAKSGFVESVRFEGPKVINRRSQLRARREVSAGVFITAGAGARQREIDHGAKRQRGGERVPGGQRVCSRGQNLIAITVQTRPLADNEVGRSAQGGCDARDVRSSAVHDTRNDSALSGFLKFCA